MALEHRGQRLQQVRRQRPRRRRLVEDARLAVTLVALAAGDEPIWTPACIRAPLARAICAHVTSVCSEPERRYAGWNTRTYSANPAGTTDRTDSAKPRNPAATQSAAPTSMAARSMLGL
jgi:hypothetical protein